MKKKYKIIIEGAGPAGVSAALNLIKLGITDILIIEKLKFPRYKCCAGYITDRTKKEYELLGLDTTKIHYSLIENFNINYKYKTKQKINNKFLYTNKNIDRVELDNAFFELIKDKKIDILENTSIKDLNENNNFIILSLNQKVYYEKIIFAGGFNSFGNKYNKILKNKNIAMQIIFNSEVKDSIDMHFGISKHGYGWVSSYNGITNVGLTDLYNKNINYLDLFKEFLKDLNFNENTNNLRGTFTPIGVKCPIINNMYYIGDSVGACDPFTLSGVKYALITGKYCALSIKENNNKIYIKYINKLKIKFNFMIIMSRIFYLKGMLFCVFNIGCTCFHDFISYVFNNYFVNKK